MIKKLFLLLIVSSVAYADDSFSFLELTKQRYSSYHFDPSKEISIDHIRLVGEAVRNTASSYNEQPWSFIICNKKTDPKAYNDLFSCLGSKNQSWAKDAPILILAIAQKISSYNHKPNIYAEYDVGAASITLSYAAVNLGFHTHQMGGFNRESVSSKFNIASDFKPMTIIAMGYVKEEELPKKVRKPLNQVFYLGSLKKGLD